MGSAENSFSWDRRALSNSRNSPGGDEVQPRARSEPPARSRYIQAYETSILILSFGLPSASTKTSKMNTISDLKPIEDVEDGPLKNWTQYTKPDLSCLNNLHTNYLFTCYF